jgi:hypothetical protein
MTRSRKSTVARRLCSGVLLFLSALGCSSDSGGEDFAGVRFFHAMTAVSRMGVTIDEEPVIASQNYGQLSRDFTVNAGSSRIRIFDTGLSVPVIDFSAEFEEGENYTVLATSAPTRDGFDYQPFVFLDDNEFPEEQRFKFRLINASFAIGRVDVYLVRERDPLEDTVPEFTDLGFSETGGYISKVPGDFVIRLTGPGGKTAILSSRRTAFVDGSIRTAMVIDDRDGREPRIILLNDAG